MSDGRPDEREGRAPEPAPAPGAWMVWVVIEHQALPGPVEAVYAVTDDERHARQLAALAEGFVTNLILPLLRRLQAAADNIVSRLVSERVAMAGTVLDHKGRPAAPKDGRVCVFAAWFAEPPVDGVPLEDQVAADETTA